MILQDVLFDADPARVLYQREEDAANYGEIAEDALRIAGFLQARGLHSREHVLVKVPKGTGFLAALFGVLTAGGVAVLAEGPVTGFDNCAFRIGEGGTPLDEMLRATPCRLSDCLRPDAGDVAVILFTSGSTGLPSGIVKTHENLMWEVGVLSSLQSRPGLRNLSTLSWAYIYGILHNLLFTMYNGGTILDTSATTPRGLLAAVEETRADFLVTVPSVYRTLVSALPDRTSFGGVTAVSSGAMLDNAIAEALVQRGGFRLREFFGSTETGGISMNAGRGHGEVAGVGRPLPGVEVRIDSSDAEAPVLQVRSPAVSKVAQIGRERRALTDAAGWYATNDIVRTDAEGNLHLMGRADRIIKVAGRRVSLDAIETSLKQIPGVADAVVSWRNGPIHGQVPCASIVLDPCGDTSQSAIREACRTRFPRHMQPREINFVARSTRVRSK